MIVGGKETVLKANDSCFIGPNESREIINRGNEVVHHAGRGLDATEVIAGRHHCDAAGSIQPESRVRVTENSSSKL